MWVWGCDSLNVLRYAYFPLTRRGETPLHHAMRVGAVVKADKLLANGAVPTIAGDQGTALEVQI